MKTQTGQIDGLPPKGQKAISYQVSNQNSSRYPKKHRHILAFALPFLFALACHAQHLLWYDRPAENWNEALPIGNGRMGGMIYGGTSVERIQLNEDSLWAGEAKDLKNVIGTPEDLAYIRQLIDDAKYAEADRELPKRFSRGRVVRSYQTLGELRLNWKNGDEQESTDYRRELDLRNAIATTEWEVAGTRYLQEVFCSNPDELILLKISAQGEGELDLDITMVRPQDEKVVTHTTKAANDYSLVMTGEATQNGGVLNDKRIQLKGTEFEARLRIGLVGGSSKATGDTLEVRGAKTLYLQLAAGTDFGSDRINAAHLQAIQLEMNEVLYQKLRARHIADHQALYDRCTLHLPVDASMAETPTAQRIEQLTDESNDSGLEALLFHYGRYLLIASSRSNGNPANLQGLWCKDIRAPWNSDYHLNINLQMNYWPAEVTGLSETTVPLFRWMQRLAENGAITAREQYGMRGWMAHHATELAAQTVMKANRAMWGAWIHGGGWMLQHVWEHYAFTQDENFLREIAYPLLAGGARFYLDWLVERDGKLVSSFETSPENRFLDSSGNAVAPCAGAAQGQQVITEVLTNTLAAAEVLGIEDNLTREIAAKLPRVESGLKVGPDGRLLEWDKPYPEAEPGHRHMTHLHAFHPGTLLTHEKTPKLLEAVRKSIDVRVANGSVGVGWSRAWAISIFARMRDGDTAHYHLREMLRTQTLANGFNSVYGLKKPIFQIEANLGATAGIAEMLLQSHGGFLHLLPALPSAWPDGSVQGLRARGGYKVNLAWKDGQLAHYQITHPSKTSTRIKIMDRAVEEIEL